MPVESDPEIEQLGTEVSAVIIKARELAKQRGRMGPVPHALNCAATHLQDALGQLLIANSGGSLGVS